jgi:dinuclear metal center YbgI/SA1388 family protein
VKLDALVHYLDEYLHITSITDYDGALNGLQVEGTRPIRRIAAAVDAAQATVERAIAGGADLLLVHHGLFWDGNRPLTGRRYRRIKPLLEAGVAVYSAHLPLDSHPDVGNNAVLLRELGAEPRGTFGEHKGMPLGVWGEVDLRREALCARLDEVLGTRVKMVPGGPEQVRRVGVITGGAASKIQDAVAAGLEAFVTGEGAHHNFFDAEEGGINLYLGGHYATEVWGVRALAEHLRGQFGIDWFFIDHPTGL